MERTQQNELKRGRNLETFGVGTVGVSHTEARRSSRKGEMPPCVPSMPCTLKTIPESLLQLQVKTNQPTNPTLKIKVKATMLLFSFWGERNTRCVCRTPEQSNSGKCGLGPRVLHSCPVSFHSGHGTRPPCYPVSLCHPVSGGPRQPSSLHSAGHSFRLPQCSSPGNRPNMSTQVRGPDGHLL